MGHRHFMSADHSGRLCDSNRDRLIIYTPVDLTEPDSLHLTGKWSHGSRLPTAQPLLLVLIRYLYVSSVPRLSPPPPHLVKLLLLYGNSPSGSAASAAWLNVQRSIQLSWRTT
jgi:hypothetical protein